MISDMAPSELRATMNAIGCPTQQALGDRIGVSRSAVSYWFHGTPIPKHIAMLLRLLRSGA